MSQQRPAVPRFFVDLTGDSGSQDENLTPGTSGPTASIAGLGSTMTSRRVTRSTIKNLSITSGQISIDKKPQAPSKRPMNDQTETEQNQLVPGYDDMESNGDGKDNHTKKRRVDYSSVNLRSSQRASVFTTHTKVPTRPPYNQNSIGAGSSSKNPKDTDENALEDNLSELSEVSDLSEDYYLDSDEFDEGYNEDDDQHISRSKRLLNKGKGPARTQGASNTETVDKGKGKVSAQPEESIAGPFNAWTAIKSRSELPSVGEVDEAFIEAQYDNRAWDHCPPQHPAQLIGLYDPRNSRATLSIGTIGISYDYTVWKYPLEFSKRELTRHINLLKHPQLRLKSLYHRDVLPPLDEPQPPGLALTLLPFQREGVSWLKRQEQGPYRGGILGDEMGMGKTIQTIALLMTEPRRKPNLIVAPTVALVQWNNEIEKHTNKALKVISFHGAKREVDKSALDDADVILTTYNVLESVYRKQQHGFKRVGGLVKEKSILHAINFHRVILDEAHNIKDRTCATAKATFALNSTYRLCLSGTPLQNRIGELFSLLRFLQIDPFAYYYCVSERCKCKSLHWRFTKGPVCDECNHSASSHICLFNHMFLKPIQKYANTGAGLKAYGYLRALLDQIMLRRTKEQKADDLGLPPRVVEIRKDRFNEEEEDFYASIYTDSVRKYNTYVASRVVLNNYANLFQLITRMRQVADHPDLVLKRHEDEGQNALVCCLCNDEAEEAIESKCHHKFCRYCITKYINESPVDPNCPRCHIKLDIDLTQPAMDQLQGVKRGSIINRIDMSSWTSSTKIEALAEELFKLRRRSEKIKSIVFSQFTSFLELVEWRLHRGGFSTVMLQGSMSPTQRDAVIRHFMTDPSVEVFLVSLKAGGVALNLTEASHVFILDPWWNPSVEWQSGDRVHRIGQKRPCKITRFVIEDSIESKIIELQQKKANMIHATVNGDHASLDKLTPEDMEFLFKN